MYTMTLNIPDDIKLRLDDWSRKSHLPPEFLPVDLLNEFFDDADDADRLEALIHSGDMETMPADFLHKELDHLAVVGN